MTDPPAALAYLGIQDPFEEAAVAVLPVPYDLTTTYQPGARFGPRALLTASHNVELYDEELRWDASRIGIHTLPPIEPVAAGPQAMIPIIADAVESLFHRGKFPVVLGGDHSVAIGCFAALSESWEDLWILQLDAHADLRGEYQGSPFSHASVMSHAAEHFECVRVGLRSWSAEEEEPLWRQPERVFPARAFMRNPDDAISRVLAVLGDPVYITLDLDCLDPSVMPATGTPEPGGLTWDAITTLLRAVAEERHVVGCDLTELSPIPGMIAPDFLAARLTYKLISYVFHARHQAGDSVPGG
ncbi:MAG: agmatinase [Candidatus Eisenbacteria bacterium]|nr:agmatinase [Candidatus Eisenbacteria bacterium]